MTRITQGAFSLLPDLTDAQIQQLAQHYDQPDSHGQYTPFCQAIAYILRQFI